MGISPERSQCRWCSRRRRGGAEGPRFGPGTGGPHDYGVVPALGLAEEEGSRGTSFWPGTGWGFHLRSSMARSRRRSSTVRSWRRIGEGGGGGQCLDHRGGARRRDRRSAENG
ncbi:uncharacterized protein A4U43_C01F23590 [Asparagus officinalis]|uniref:Uncharacterized protein n=1 Tax=Asparagus officinalis TaxID=4686 RepID=A0A5P1FRU8_ASPOF|nr:uncharacterized protein A4U43_C01F23590 [Asparagus officinalis]